MLTNLISMEKIVDNALQKASKVLMLISIPALLLSMYRNLIIDFLPLYQTAVTLVWLGFLLGSTNKLNLVKIRLYLVVILFLALFLLTGFRNQSIIFVDIWLVIAGGLLAFRQSLRVIFIILAIFSVGLLFMINEQFIFPGVEYQVHLAIHGTALILSFVLFHTIKTVVQNYQVIYEAQMSTNQKLAEENKKSFLKIAKGNETVEQERQRLKLSTFSLSSQMSILEKVVKLANKNDDPNLLGHASTRIEQLNEDLFKYTSNGSYIDSETQTLSISELAFTIEQYLRPFKVISSDSTVISFQNSKILEAKFHFPVNFLKIICHHLMEYSLKDLNPAKVSFEFQIAGNLVRNKQQIKMTCVMQPVKDISKPESLTFNKFMGRDQIYGEVNNHLKMIKTIVDRMSASMRSTLIEANLEYELLFWADKYADNTSVTPPPRIRDIFGFS